MTVVATAEVRIQPDINLKNLNSQITKEVDKAAVDVQRASAARFKSVGDNLTKFVTLPVLAGFGLATKAASDLEEQLTKTEQVFGDSAGEVKAFGKEAVESVGLSERAALEAAGTYGNLFRAIGLTADKSADMSVQLIKLSGDLASFNNANPEEVFEALRAGLTGEAEPLKRFGININEARIQQEALNLGLLQGGKALDASAKAQAVYSLIMKDTTLAQGDFGRTSDGLANKSRILQAQLEDTAASIGSKLIPVALTLANVASDLLDGFSKLPPAVQNLVILAATAGAAAGPLLKLRGTILDIGAGFEVGSKKATVFNTAVKGIGTLGLVITALGVVNALVERVGGSSEASAEDVEKMEVALLELNTGASKAVPSVANLSGRLEKFHDLVGSFSQADRREREQIFATLTGDLDALDKGLASLVDKGLLPAAQQELERFAAANGVSAAELTAIPGLLDDYATALDKQKLSQQSNTLSAEAAAKANLESEDPIVRATQAYDSLARAVQEAKRQQDIFIGVQLNQEEANDRAVQAFSDLSESIKTNGDVFSGNSAAALENRDKRRAVIQAVLAQQLAEEQAGGTTQTASQRFQRQSQILDILGREAGLSKDQIDGIRSTLSLVPPETPANIKTNAKEAQREVAEFFTDLGNRVRTGDFRVDVRPRGLAGGRIPRMAGGPVYPGSSYVVNEAKNGGEFFFPETRGRILSNADSRSALANAASGPSVMVTFAPVIHGGNRGTVEELRRLVRNELGKVISQAVAKARPPAGIVA